MHRILSSLTFIMLISLITISIGCEDKKISPEKPEETEVTSSDNMDKETGNEPVATTQPVVPVIPTEEAFPDSAGEAEEPESQPVRTVDPLPETPPENDNTPPLVKVDPPPTPEIEEEPTEKPPAIPEPLGQEEHELISRLQQQTRKLDRQLNAQRTKNEKLVDALVRSRKACDKLQVELQRHKLLLQIAQIKTTDDGPAVSTSEKPKIPFPETQPAAETTDPDELIPMKPGDSSLEILQKYKRLSNLYKKMKLQNQLLLLDESEQTNKLVAEINSQNGKIAELEQLHKELCHTIATQSESIDASRKQIDALTRQLSDLQIALNDSNSPAVDKPLPVESPDLPGNNDSVPEVKQPPDSPVIIPTRISGKIVDITGMTITINIGGKNKVEKGMRMIVYREDNFIGYLTIIEVQQDRSIGTLTRRIRSPMIDDSVIDEESLNNQMAETINGR